jgi:hypothetical protein
MRAQLALVASMLLAACQSGATPGAACMRSTECGGSLVCRLGRCRAECASDRDCPLGARCYLASEVGACELPAIDVCAAIACAPPLVCRDGRCSQVCETASDCGGGACVAGTCERATGDAGVLADGSVARRQTCTAPSDCPAGSACTSIGGGVFYCRPSCATSSDCVGHVGPASTCVEMMRMDAAMGLWTCTLPCHIAPDDCAIGDTCRPTTAQEFPSANYVNIVECDTVGTHPFGTTCATDEDCGPHATCSNTTCRALCDRSAGAPATCAAPTICNQFSAVAVYVDGVEWGACY